MGKIKGNLCVVELDSVELASQRELSIEISDELMDATVKGDSSKVRVPLSEYDISSSVGGLYETGAASGAGVNDAISTLTGSVKATMLITSTATGAPTYQFEAYISNISVEMNKDDLVTYSMDFASTGDLTVGVVS